LGWTRVQPRLLLALPLILVACEEPLPPPRDVDPKLAGEVIAFLNTIQPPSIAKNVEYCGYFGLDPSGELVATDPFKGETDSCTIPEWPEDMAVIASYHSHAGFDEEADSEVPSSDDLISDIEEGVDGFISTPGGRVWFVDHEAQAAYQLCPMSCVTRDPDFVPGDAGPIAQEYRLDDLLERENG
ncbi:MAG: DUF4329 domain-containing protein, partial [Pseudomonadota bacterium]